MGYLAHEVDVGKFRQLFFERNFAGPGGAEVYEIIHIQAEVNGRFRAPGPEHAWVVGGGKQTTLSEERSHFDIPVLWGPFEAIESLLK